MFGESLPPPVAVHDPSCVVSELVDKYRLDSKCLLSAGVLLSVLYGSYLTHLFTSFVNGGMSLEMLSNSALESWL